MTMNQIIIIVILLSGLAESASAECSVGWEAYENEKCFKVFNNAGLLAYDSPELYCKQVDSNASLISLHSANEQDFISNYLFKTNNIVDTVWIGARNNSVTSKFRWSDNTDVTFTDWADGSPTNKTNYDCIQMMPDSSPQGKWVDQPCTKKNAVLCQKQQVWSLAVIQMFIQEINLKLKNQVPVGFIYVQLPKQSEPKVLWPELNWKNISAEYSGHFFRVEGGNSAEFGTPQMDAFQGHDHEKFVFNETAYSNYANGGTWNTEWVHKLGSINQVFKNTPLSNGANGIPRNASETRPVNYSVRVWKRIE